MNLCPNVSALNARRPTSHEVELHTPHHVEPSEIVAAEASLSQWNAREALLEIDSPEWRSACYIIGDIEGWIFNARESGKTRRSFVRCLQISIERKAADATESKGNGL